jgi:hypothetical protein
VDADMPREELAERPERADDDDELVEELRSRSAGIVKRNQRHERDGDKRERRIGVQDRSRWCIHAVEI